MEAVTYSSVTHIQVWPGAWSSPAFQRTSLNWEEIWIQSFYDSFKKVFTYLFLVSLEILDYRENTSTVVQLRFWVFPVLG